MSEPRFQPSPTVPSGAPPDGCDPADANRSWPWLESMAQLGFVCVCVEMAFDAAKLQRFGHPEILCPLLITEEFGHFDSLGKGDPFTLFYYVDGTRLAEALRFIRTQLAAHGLLSIAKVGYADVKPQCWRTFLTFNAEGNV